MIGAGSGGGRASDPRSTPLRPLALAAAAIALLTGAALLLLYLVSVPGTAGQAALSARSPAAKEEPAPRAPPAAAPARLPAAVDPAADAAPPPASSPSAAPLSEAPRVLLRPIVPVARALTPLVARCVPQGLAAREAARRGPRRTGRDAGPAALLVELVAAGDVLEVTDVGIASYGELAREQLECAEQAVKGRRLPVPTGFRFEPGQRVRMRLPLP